MLGGMLADKKLHEEETTRESIGSLEVVDAELQSNIEAVKVIKDAIQQRPSLALRGNFTLDKILELANEEEEWIGGFSGQLSDSSYHTVLSTLSKIDNRKLFERLVNTYRDLRNMRLVLGLRILNNDTSSYTDRQKNEFIKMGDQQFCMLITNLSVFEEKLKNTEKDLIDGEKKLLPKIRTK